MIDVIRRLREYAGRPESLKLTPNDAQDIADEFERLRVENEQFHARGLELAKALAVCIESIAPSDRSGISMSEWNQRLKAAQKQACAALSVCKPNDTESK